MATKLVYPGDVDYPVATTRFMGNLEIRVEVVYDGDGEDLADDMYLLVKRALKARGCDVWGGDSGMDNLPHRVEQPAAGD